MNKGEDSKIPDLERKIRKQVACEERAHRLVEKLLETQISEKFLIETGKLITSNHYQDVTEERAIAKICGYPICSTPIKNVPKQKYKISTKNNRVYDISERKNFCSNQCYKASEYFSHQIPVSPVWAREEEPPQCITLLDRNVIRGEKGKEVFAIPREEVAKEVQMLKRGSISQKEATVPQNKGLLGELETIEPEVTSIKDLAQQVSDMMLVDRPGGGDTSLKTDNVVPPSVNSDNEERAGHTEELSKEKTECVDDRTSDKCSDNRGAGTPVSSNIKVNSIGKEQLEVSETSGDKTGGPSLQELSKEKSAATSTSGSGNQPTKEDNSSDDVVVANVEVPLDNEGSDEGYDETIVESSSHQKKRIVPEMTREKAAVLMDLIDKRDRLKKELREAPKTARKPLSTVSDTASPRPDLTSNPLGPLTVEIAPEQNKHELPSHNSKDLEKEFEEKLKTGDINEIKDLFSQITLSENRGTKKRRVPDEEPMLLSLSSAQSPASATQIPPRNKDKHCDNEQSEKSEKQGTECCLGDGASSSLLVSSHSLDPVDEARQTIIPKLEAQIIQQTDKPFHQKLSTASFSPGTTETKVGKNPKITSTAIIDNIRRLQEQSADLDDDDLESKKPEVKVKKKKRVKKVPVTLMGLLRGVLENWITDGTRDFLKGSESESELSREEFRLKYAALERKIDKVLADDFAQDGLAEGVISQPQKKLPHFNQIRKDTKVFDLKVQEFYSGSFKYPNNIEEESAEDIVVTTEDGIKEKQSSIKPVLPLVDGRQQHLIRQKIVMDRLDKVLPDILGPMKISIEDVTSDLRNMVSTFHLTSENVLLKPAEWTLVSYLLLRLLAFRNRNLQERLDAEQSNIFIEIILKKIGSSREEINSITSDLIVGR